MKVTGSFAVFKTVYHNRSYLLLFGKKKSQNVDVNNSSYFEISTSLV